MAPSFDCCIKANVHSGTPVGAEETLAGLQTYITGANTADKAILIIPDVHSISLVNAKLLADKFAHAIGARVYIPDFFHGEDIIKLSEKSPNEDRGNLVKYMIGKFSPRDTSVFPPVVEAIRKAQPSAKKVGSIGFCWGGPGSVFLGTKAAGAGQVDAVAFAHPSLLEASDFESLQRPGLFMTCENDGMFPKEKQEASKKVLEKIAKDEDVFTRMSYYPFVSHGWSMKGDEANPYSAKAMAHAAVEAIGFFSLELSS